MTTLVNVTFLTSLSIFFNKRHPINPQCIILFLHSQKILLFHLYYSLIRFLTPFLLIADALPNTSLYKHPTNPPHGL